MFFVYLLHYFSFGVFVVGLVVSLAAIVEMSIVSHNIRAKAAILEKKRLGRIVLFCEEESGRVALVGMYVF